MKWTVPVPTTIRTLRAAAWQGHYLPKEVTWDLRTHSLAGAEVANPNRTRGGTAGSTFVKASAPGDYELDRRRSAMRRDYRRDTEF